MAHWRKALAKALLTLGVVAFFASVSGAALQQNPQSARSEEAADPFKKWLEQDVKYIITDEEKQAFLQLTAPEEKESFIEEFWRRRDPDPRTGFNEFREEHYRRIAYANDHFTSGFAGWMTDRGRVYIIHGPPDQIERHPSGGAYQRPIHEGGGATATYPFEIWYYRHLPGLGSSIELEFVDRTWNEDYRLALRADEKDAFLDVPGHGMTLAEQIGLTTKPERMRHRANPAVRELYPLMQHRMQDSIFQRYQNFAMAKAAPEIKYPELKEMVDVQVGFDPIPVSVRPDYFLLSDRQVLVPVTLEIDNGNLSFEFENGVYRARIGVYGIVRTITNRVLTEFEEDLFSTHATNPAESGRSPGKTVFQKILILDAKMRYRLDLVAKDLRSGRVGVIRTGFAPPAFDAQGPQASSVVLADLIQVLPENSDLTEMFALGDLKVRPSSGGRFPMGGTLGVYLHLYDVALDQSDFTPALRLTYRVLSEGKTVFELIDEMGGSVHSFNERRVILAKGIPLHNLAAGKYQLQIVAEDRIQDRSVTAESEFTVVAMGSNGD